MRQSRTRKPRPELSKLAVLAALGMLLCSLSARAQEGASEPDEPGGVPRMSWNTPQGSSARCLSDDEGNLVFAQCGEGRCLYSDVIEAERLRTPCRYAEGSLEELASGGKVELVYARREAPPGWYRDASGRVYQVTFDLRRRLYLGGGYAPTLALGEGDSVRHSSFFELGFIAEWNAGRARNRVRLFETRLTLTPLQLEATAVRYDRVHASDAAGLRLTTFFGEPRRHDIRTNLGWGLDVARARSGLLSREDDPTEMRWFTFFLGIDLVQGRGLENALRLRVGPGLSSLLGEELEGTRLAASVQTALEALITPDGAGLSSFTATLSHERYWPFGADGAFYDGHELAGSLGYERILIAINDQPLSWTIGVEGLWRPQLEERESELRAVSGLRFSLWAPARREPNGD